MPTEVSFIALFALTVGVLVLVSVVLSRATGRVGLPVALLFIGVGVVAGSEGIGWIHFEDYGLTFQIGSVALALILFDGGLNTPVSVVRDALRPAAVLATAGVVLTALVTAGCAWLIGFQPSTALLFGAIVSSTDAAAVFAVLRGSGIELRQRVGSTLELESGLNDPMAVILTMAATSAIVEGEPLLGWSLPLGVLTQLVIGLAIGGTVGVVGRWLLRRVRLGAAGLFPALTLAVALLSFGAATLLNGSGFLAVFVTGVVVGARQIPYRAGLKRIHDAVAWLSQITMFLLLGVLVFPSRLFDVALPGTILALALALVARPLAVLLCLSPFPSFTRRERLYISWVGLRGAVPIILATYPVMVGAAGAEDVFDLVFFIVVVNAVLPGSTIGYLARRFGLQANNPPLPPAALEINAADEYEGKLIAFYIQEQSAAAQATISQLALPTEVSVVLVIRGASRMLIPARGHTRLEPGDHVYVMTPTEHEGTVELVFGGRVPLPM